MTRRPAPRPSRPPSARALDAAVSRVEREARRLLRAPPDAPRDAAALDRAFATLRRLVAALTA